MFVSYSGDQDAIIPLTQTRIIANNVAKDLKLVPFTEYGTWYDKKQVCKPTNTWVSHMAYTVHGMWQGLEPSGWLTENWSHYWNQIGILQVGGWTQSFGGLREGKNVTLLTFATVRGAAHEVPFTSPSQALTMFKSFLSGSPLPRPHEWFLATCWPSYTLKKGHVWPTVL